MSDQVRDRRAQLDVGVVERRRYDPKRGCQVPKRYRPRRPKRRR